ncbi:MAG: GntR family transcriptional regulator [Kiritimatiellae bacterium]|nr:GntR family transcriptional regulator [Kiritimatiellia bacterium]
MKKALKRDKRIPLHRQCADMLRAAIESGRYALDEYLPSERDLSTMLGVNRLTLRKGIAELIRAGMIESVPGSGNRVVMKEARSARAHAVGCVMPRREGPLAQSPYYADILQSIEAEITGAGFDLVLASVRVEDLWRGPGQARSNPPTIAARVDGVILIGGLSDELAQAYLKKGAAVAFVDNGSRLAEVSSVVPDNEAGGYEAARHLLDLGHRQFGFLRGPADPASDARVAGCERALREAGAKLSRAAVVEAGYAVTGGYEATRRLVRGGKAKLPTALLCANDECAIGALRALRESGVAVPKDVSLVGFDDIALAAHTFPPLTTVRIQRAEMGRLGARLLLDRIREPGTSATSLLLKTELAVRGSTAAPRGPV